MFQRPAGNVVGGDGKRPPLLWSGGSIVTSRRLSQAALNGSEANSNPASVHIISPARAAVNGL
jgi:hypothetical protein